MAVTDEAGRPSLEPGNRPWRIRRWLVLALACGIGTAMGLGGYVFRYAEGLSYFRTEPAACANCHIMQPQYDAWQKASHHARRGVRRLPPAAATSCASTWPRPKTATGTASSSRRRRSPSRLPFRLADARSCEENCVRCHERSCTSSRRARGGRAATGSRACTAIAASDTANRHGSAGRSHEQELEVGHD